MSIVRERMDAGVYEHKIPYSKETRKEYEEEKNFIIELFKKDLFKEFGIEDNPKKEKAFNLAWSYSCSFMQVYDYFSKFVELII